MTRRRLKHVDLCADCLRTGSGGFHWTDDLVPRAYRCPEYVKSRCGTCGGTGWDSRDPLGTSACDHGATEATIEAAERADRARFCPSCDEGYGPCRCPDPS